MYDWEYDYSSRLGGITIRLYFGKDREVIIPREIKGKPVRSIGCGAFRDCEKLESVVISDGVEEICWDAFNNCKALKNIVIPESVTLIQAGAFTGTPWLKKSVRKVRL